RPFRDTLGPRVVVGERLILAPHGPRVALLAGARRPPLEAVEPLDDVAEEARLALLAVGDDVDARLDLLAHRLRHGRARETAELGGVVRLRALLVPQERDEGLGPREAADVRGQDPMRAPFHGSTAFASILSLAAGDGVVFGASPAWEASYPISRRREHATTI